MSERNIHISPYVKADNLIDLSGHITLPGVEQRIDIPDRKHLILYNHSLNSGEVIVPRNYSTVNIYVKPSLSKGRTLNDFSHLLIQGESIENTMRLRIHVWCKTTRWCSNQVSLTVNEINGKNTINFEIPLTEVKDELVISGFLTREVTNLKSEVRKANTIYSVLSNCEDISIQIDERREIGGNHLPIDFEDLTDRDMVFDINGLDNDFELPRIKCATEFKEYFVRDDIKTVNASFLMGMFFFLDSYLKWLIFNCKYDPHDKNHKALIDSFAKYCSISKISLVEIVEDRKYSDNQIKQYLLLSRKLIRGLQCESAIKYARELKNMIKDEIR